MDSLLTKIALFYGNFNMTTLVIAFLFATLILALLKMSSRKGLRLPPGPFSLPIIGHIHKVGMKPHLYYEQLREKYGNMYSLYIGTHYTVVICSPQLVKEAGLLDEFLAKPPKLITISPDSENISDINGEDWKVQRKFFLKVFRSLGMGRSEGENAVQVQISAFLEQLRNAKKLGDPKGIYIRNFFFPAINNVLLTMLCNRTYQDDEKMTERLKIFSQETNQYFLSQIIRYYMPWMKVIDAIRGNKVRTTYKKLLTELEDNVISEEVTRHENNYTGVENLDYLDFYIEQLRKPGAHKSFSRENMFNNFEMMMVAGSDTTRIIMEWYLYHLAKNQDIQEKVYQEIMEVVGKERLPQWEDRAKMPYLQALLLEIQRWRPVIPISLPRLTLEDFNFAGYDIPKNTLVTLNFWSVHNDVELWGDPENFRPKRFWTEDGKRINHLEQYINTFSTGKRNCPGEKLANVHLFLYLTAMLQVFRLVPPKNGFPKEGSGTFENEIELRIALEAREL